MSHSEATQRLRAVQVRGVTRLFGATPALRGVSVDLDAGSVTLLTGPNGAGKTTLLSIIGTQLKPTRGEVRYLGHGAALDLPLVRAQLGWVSHDSHCYRELTARQNVELAARLFSRDRAFVSCVGIVGDRRAKKIKTALGLGDLPWGLAIALGPLGGLVAGLFTAALIRRYASANVSIATTLISLVTLLLLASASHWAVFARRYRAHPAEALSFNLLNEPPHGVSETVYREVLRDSLAAAEATVAAGSDREGAQ